MFKKKVPKVIAFGMAIYLAIPFNVFATPINLSNSTENIVTDELDETNGTDYFTDETTNNWQNGEISEETRVSVQKSSSFEIIIPKEIVLDGDTGKADYKVRAKGDIAGDQQLRVKPDASFKLKEAGGKSDITANVAQENYYFSYMDMLNEGTEYNGNVSANLTAGEWSGEFNFNIDFLERPYNEPNGYLAAYITTDNESTQTQGFASFDDLKNFIFRNKSTLTTFKITDAYIEPIEILSVSELLEVNNPLNTFKLATINEKEDVPILLTNNTNTYLDASYLFSNCVNLKEVDLSGLDTSKINNMRGMFSECSSLVKLNLKNIDTSKVTNTGGMFYNCSSLTELDLSNFDTSNVIYMGAMFEKCYNLINLDISSFNTSKVTNMSNMFISCSNLTELNLSSFNTSNVISMMQMFFGCGKLIELNLSSFDTSKVTDMSGMFSRCNNLKKINLSSFNTSNVTDMSRMFGGEYGGCPSLKELNVSNFDTSKVTSMDYMFGARYGYGCSNLVTLDLSSFDTSNVTSMGYMFSGCYNLTNLNLSSFDTSNVIGFNGMFYGCSGLTELDLSNFDTSKITYMDSTFRFCSNLVKLDLSSFDTSKVTDMDYVFGSCGNLVTIYVSDLWNISSVQYAYDMFYGATNLYGACKYTNSDHRKANYKNGYFTYKGRLLPDKVNKFTVKFTDTEDVEKTVEFSNYNQLFNFISENQALRKIKIITKGNIEVTDLNKLFYNCGNLIETDISQINTLNITNMSQMFYNCGNLLTIDLSKIDTSNVTNMDQMFYDCNVLKSIYVSDLWNTTNVISSENMFYRCSNLIGAISFDAEKVDISYANYETGYLTYK